jgi:hypothetical protein
MSSLIVLCISFYYRFVLLLHYELMPPRTSVAYVQTILSDVARASLQLVPPLISHVCHRSGPDLFCTIPSCSNKREQVIRKMLELEQYSSFFYLDFSLT